MDPYKLTKWYVGRDNIWKARMAYLFRTGLKLILYRNRLKVDPVNLWAGLNLSETQFT